MLYNKLIKKNFNLCNLCIKKQNKTLNVRKYYLLKNQ